jgi:hypothetical protein
MKKNCGFIFSAEALISIALLIVAATIIINASQSADNYQKNFFKQRAENDAAMGVYFNDSNKIPTGFENNISCKKITDYNSDAKVFEKEFCEGAQ